MENNIMLNKPRVLVKVIGEMNKVERLIYNYFLTLITTPNTKKDDKGYYYTSLYKINKITNTNNFKKIKDYLMNLQHTSLHINILEEEIYVSLIGEIKIFDNNEVKLFFTPSIIELAKHKTLNYAKIDLTLLAKLNSKYSLTIYELIKTYYNKRNNKITIPDLTILQFRKLMGVENKLKTNQHLKDKVLEQAKTDISNKTDFNLDYKFLKKNSNSKKFTHIRLIYTKKSDTDTNTLETEKDSNNEDSIEYISLKSEITRLQTLLAEERETSQGTIDYLNKGLNSAIIDLELQDRQLNPQNY